MYFVQTFSRQKIKDSINTIRIGFLKGECQNQSIDDTFLLKELFFEVQRCI